MNQIAAVVGLVAIFAFFYAVAYWWAWSLANMKCDCKRCRERLANRLHQPPA